MKTKLQTLITICTLLISLSLYAQPEKINEHLFSGSPIGFLRNAISTPTRIFYLGVEIDYQWRFSERFSIGASGNYSYYNQSSSGSSYTSIFAAPEGRYWFPIKNNRLSPFLFINYGMQSGFTGYSAGSNTSLVFGAGHAGLGLIGWINLRWEVQAKYNVIITNRDNIEFNPTLSNIQFGVVFKPGAKNKEEKK